MLIVLRFRIILCIWDVCSTYLIVIQVLSSEQKSTKRIETSNQTPCILDKLHKLASLLACLFTIWCNFVWYRYTSSIWRHCEHTITNFDDWTMDWKLKFSSFQICNNHHNWCIHSNSVSDSSLPLKNTLFGWLNDACMEILL